jgi:HEAT repeat protein
MNKRIFFLFFTVLAGCARNLENNLVSSDESIRQAALQKLDGADPDLRREVVQGLVARLASENGNVRRRAIQALARMGTDAVTPLAKSLSNPDPKVRSAAAETLSLLGYAAKSAVGALVDAEQDKEDEVRSWAVLAVGRITEEMSDAERQLFQLIYGKKSFALPVRAGAPAAPAPSTGDIKGLLKALGTADPKRRAEAILVLVGKGAVAVPSLVSSLTSADEGIREGAAEALRLLTRDQADADAAVALLLKDADRASREASQKAFRGVDKNSPEALAGLLSHPAFVVRLEAAAALGSLGAAAKGQAPALRKLLNDPHPLLRRAGVRALTRLQRSPPSAAQAVLAKHLDADWRRMTDHLSRGEVEKALDFFSAPQRDFYREAFLSLDRRLPALAKGLTVPLSFNDAFGERFITLGGKAYIEGVEQRLLVQFVQEDDGLWRIRGF